LNELPNYIIQRLKLSLAFLRWLYGLLRWSLFRRRFFRRHWSRFEPFEHVEREKDLRVKVDSQFTKRTQFNFGRDG